MYSTEQMLQERQVRTSENAPISTEQMLPERQVRTSENAPISTEQMLQERQVRTSENAPIIYRDKTCGIHCPANRGRHFYR